MIIKADKLPAPGETVIGGTFLMNPGGKGADKTVAAARIAASISVTCMGAQASISYRHEVSTLPLLSYKFKNQYETGETTPLVSAPFW